MDIDKIIKTSIKHDEHTQEWLKDKEKQRVWIETNLEEFVKDGNIDAFIRSLEYFIKARGRGAPKTV